MNYQSIKKLHVALKNKEISSKELTINFLNQIKNKKHLNAFISIDEEYAINQAKKADERILKNLHTQLNGIPFAHKDIFCTKVMPTTCGSKMLENFISPYDATIVTLLNNQGAVCLGKTNMDEFAMGSSTKSSYFGKTLNPYDVTCTPGGSSGGSAACVAAKLCAFATGSDTGGSVRQPSAFCNISGLKPTYGLLSRFGLVAYASSLDTPGIMAQSAEDLAIVLQELAVFDEKDSTSAKVDIPNYSHEISKPLTSFKIGLPRSFFHDETDKNIQQAILNAVKVFESLGAQIIDLDLINQPNWIPCYYIIACAEASSNLSRYDGLRYGHRSQKDSTLQELIISSREEGFGLEVKRRILLGTQVLCSGFYDDYYVKAQKIRRLILNDFIAAFNDVDIILGPTTPTCAFKLDNAIQNPTHQYLADVFTVGANLAGIPALSIPCGFNHEGLPIGIQLMAKHFDEAKLLQIAHNYQLHTDWHLLKGEL